MAPISIRDVKKSYGKHPVVHGVDLEIQSGEFIVILGPSGCGKSTLLRMIAGLEEITGGEIAIDGRVVNQMEPRERGCAMVFQNYALYPHMTVAENIGYALKVAGVAKAERSRRIAEVAKALSLEPFLDRRPAALSGGQRQRVAMGRAMIREPKVFLFDEPLSNLDAKLRIAMRAEIRRLHRRLGATSIFVTHDQTEAMTLADRLVVMNGGRVEQVGTPEEVYHRPVSRFVAGFVGTPAMNLLEGTINDEGVFVYDQSRKIALPRERAASLKGKRVVLGMRAEAARLVAPDAPGALGATADFIEELGASRVVHADFDGLPFAVALTDAVTVKSGDPIGIAIDHNAIHLYAADTGRIIENSAMSSAGAVHA
ncbi:MULTISPECIES: sn-glycerol-3-phosphate import ATP-binding protein UgpC [Rhizobium]|uniref:sn-glycerol-3-phosphate import ATP-binding protein UgpC n=1 Tax=Rhizobium phaseoli TaxID=396 RepID=UPI0004DA0F38|nr:sn-glycerol-3-phosphate import ATP-binding protein UgpC [Rhizobium phaseoli]ANL35569.1 sn-glycerol-3-phosphate ABC transporter ATP-binding protein UgpC 2 [Rhizobium phaseoli]ANL99292.1 sn-glycerol-3-phosphate ABC transporter ATP-binding protein UgpC 2 [Rhizobium phaseoli]KEC74369.1 glycerol-3-phosphate transporter ATP-binding subunit [Rhizobium leguminosarum bv. phaseoli CCGM1]PWI53010.1 sn-glycerol-3-phosphate ABC transporter ATP-binding protein UgpC [Rhizobium phaseoli]